MIYNEFFFDVNHLNLENLKYLCLISDFLGSIDTKKHSYQNLDDLIPINMAGLNFTIQNIKNKDGEINNYLKISFKTTIAVSYTHLFLGTAPPNTSSSKTNSSSHGSNLINTSPY